MNIVAYCRVSTDQADQLNSLQTQKGFFEEFAERKGHRLVRIYADEGISGTKLTKRKEFLRLMHDAEQGFFDMVVVKDISRFARNTVDFLQSIRRLKALGIETNFLTANMTVLGNSEFVLTIFGALAQEESANTSKRIKFGKKRNAEKGKVPNIVYGYDKIAGDYFSMTINEKEAEVIRRIYTWYVDGGYGTRKIAEMLNQKGIPTKRHGNWSQAGVLRILNNELYTGKVINGKQEVGDFLTGVRVNKNASEWLITQRPELQIITPEWFKQAQKVAKERNLALNVHRERQSNKHLFSTLIKCKECGYSFRRMERKYKNTYVSWVCSGRNINGADSCPNKTVISEPALVAGLDQYFAQVLTKKADVTKHLVREFIRIYKAKDDNASYEKELRYKLDKLKKSRQKYIDMYTDDLISREELNAKIGDARDEVNRLENELKIASYNLNKGERLEDIIRERFQTIGDIVSVQELDNAALKRIIKRIQADKEQGIDVYLHQ